MQSRLLRILILLLILFIITPAVFANEPGTLAQSSGSMKFMFWAFLLGGLSAISLVLGSALGIIWQPPPKVTAAFTAFGAGALLAALSVELIAPTVIEFVDQNHLTHGEINGHKMSLEFTFLIGGCILGGILFYFLNEVLNNKGGYLRKSSTVISYFNHQRRDRFHMALKRLSRIKLFRSIPPSHMDSLVQHIRHLHIKAGRTILHKGEKVNRLLIIENGEVETFINGNPVQVYGPGNLIGETSLLYHEPATYDAVARTDLKVFELTQNDFSSIHDSCPELQTILENETKHELMLEIDNQEEDSNNHKQAKAWTAMAAYHLHNTSYVPSQTEINQAANKHSSAPLSIWLGIFLDGIPESFVIGAGFLLILSSRLSQAAIAFYNVVPYTLIAGLFLSNLPEAMSSSIGMKKMGWKTLKIILLWTSLMVMTAVGSAFGYHYGTKVPNYIEIGVEGMASGAMLTMIAQTMIPEAVHIGGNKVTGLSTLAGYLAAVAFKIFE